MTKQLTTDVFKICAWHLDKKEVQDDHINLFLAGNDHRIRVLKSKTNFNGKRYWFSCPSCGRRCGCLYRISESLLCCYKCSGLSYPGWAKRKNRLLQLVLKLKKMEEKMHKKYLHKSTKQKLEVKRKEILASINQLTLEKK